jgi:hypothetical protein
LSVSTPPKNGLRTFRPTSRTNAAGAPISKLRNVSFYLQNYVDRYEGRYHDIPSTSNASGVTVWRKKEKCGTHFLKA